MCIRDRTTAPSVIYRVKKTDGQELTIDNPTNLPNPAEIEYMEEPMVEATIMTPSDYTGPIMEPVSYTHLDVYKRQALRAASWYPSGPA